MIIESKEQVKTPKKNIIIGDPKMDTSSVIEFRGKGNILVAEENVRLSDSRIVFCGDNALVYLSSNTKHVYKIVLDAWRETTIYFGRDNYYNGALHAVISERKNLIVGGNGVFSFGIWIRTADPHLIYDIHTKQRINESKSVFIGDHVWLGQNALLLKGNRIGSGSIVSAACVLSGKTVESNTIYAGNPGRMIKEDIFFSGASVHNYTRKQTKESRTFEGNNFIFENKNALDMNRIDRELSKEKEAESRLEILKDLLVSTENEKNRFFIGRQGDKKTNQNQGWLKRAFHKKG